MKAIGFNRPLPATHPEALLDIELPEPTLTPNDLLIGAASGVGSITLQLARQLTDLRLIAPDSMTPWRSS